MPYREPEIEKFLFTIGEVADMFKVNVSLIRYWETRFDILKPRKNKKGNRLFTKEDVENLRLIYYLVKEKGMTINGAKLKLRQNREETVNNHEIIARLQDIKQKLIDLSKSMEG